eukprot:g11888.t1
MLLVANQRLGVSRMYSFNSTSCDQLLCPLAEFKTPGVYNVAYNVSEDGLLACFGRSCSDRFVGTVWTLTRAQWLKGRADSNSSI